MLNMYCIYKQVGGSISYETKSALELQKWIDYESTMKLIANYFDNLILMIDQ